MDGHDEAPAGDTFLVEQPAFSGSLPQLLTELRSGRLAPSSLDLLGLVQSWLAYFRRVSERDFDDASAALPQLAQVLELKLRLLLPRPPREAADDELEEVLDTVSELADMDSAVAFLRERREERRLLLSARAELALKPGRRERKQKPEPASLARLAGRLTGAGYFEVHRESFGFREALSRLRQLFRGRRHLSFSEVRAGHGWTEVTLLFAALLELVRQGRTSAVQAEPFGEISISVEERAGAVPSD